MIYRGDRADLRRLIVDDQERSVFRRDQMVVHLIANRLAGHGVPPYTENASHRCIRSRCCSRLLSMKSVSSVLPEATQTVPEVGSGCHCTTRDITLHIASYFFRVVCPGGSGRGHPKSTATDGYGDQEQLERAEKSQGEPCR